MSLDDFKHGDVAPFETAGERLKRREPETLTIGGVEYSPQPAGVNGAFPDSHDATGTPSGRARPDGDEFGHASRGGQPQGRATGLDPSEGGPLRASPEEHESRAHLLPGIASDPAGLRAASTDAVHGAPSSPAGSCLPQRVETSGSTLSVTLGEGPSVILKLVSTALGVSLDEAAGRAVCFYAEHGLGIPALLRGEFSDVPAFDRAQVSRHPAEGRKSDRTSDLMVRPAGAPAAEGGDAAREADSREANQTAPP